MNDLEQRISQLEQELYGKSITIPRHYSSTTLSSPQSPLPPLSSSPSPKTTTTTNENDEKQNENNQNNENDENDKEQSPLSPPPSQPAPSPLLSHLTEDQLQKFYFVKHSLMYSSSSSSNGSNGSEVHGWVTELLDGSIDEHHHKQFLWDDRSILRAFEGYGWNVNTANNVLRRVMQWRTKHAPHRIRMCDLKHVGPSGLVHLYGFDKCNRPILYVNARNLNFSDSSRGGDVDPYSDENIALKFNYLLYGIEKCFYYLPEDQHRITWIFDMTDAPLSISLVRKLRAMFEQLGDYYPEIINVLMICNVSWTLRLVWKVVSSFISEHVLRRYFVFGSGETERFQQFLREHVEVDVLLESIGGPVSNPFHYEKIVELEELLERFNRQFEECTQSVEDNEKVENRFDKETPATSSNIDDDLD